jgi:hypothetical protein
MALSVNIVNNGLGRPLPGRGDMLVVPIGFNVTAGAIEASPTYEKSLDGINWFPFNSSSGFNFDGYISQFILPVGTYSFYIREVGHTSNSWSSLNNYITYDNSSLGLHGFSTTPKFVSTYIQSGTNRQISIKGEAGQLINLYTTKLVSSQEIFDLSDESLLVTSGIADADGIYIVSVPTIRPGQKFAAAGISEFGLESLSANVIEADYTYAGGSKQLDIGISISSTTMTGRNVTVTVVGGSGNYAISSDFITWNYTVNQAIPLEFGRKFLAVKDLTTGYVFTKSVHIVPAGQQTSTDISLRGLFSSTANPSSGWTFGQIDNNVFTAFDNFGVKGDKQAWSIGTQESPAVGYGTNSNPIGVSNLALYPTTTKQAVAKYTFSNSGVFNSTSLEIVKPTTGGNYPTLMCYTRYRILLNTTELLGGVLTFKDEKVVLNLSNLSVQNGDTLSIIADSASDQDTGEGLYDIIFVTFQGQLVSTSYIAPTAPSAPTLVNGTGGSIATINTNTSIKFKTSPIDDYIAVYKNDRLLSVIKSVFNGTDYTYEYLMSKEGSYKIRTVKNGVFSSSYSSNFTVKTTGASAPNAPVIASSTNIIKGETITVVVPSSGLLAVYKDNVLQAEIFSTGGNVYYTTLATGSFTFKFIKNGLYSAASTAVVVGAGSVNCNQFVNNFALGTNDLGNALTIFLVNGNLLIAETAPYGRVLRNANYINSDKVTSVYKGYSTCFGFPKPDVNSILSISDVGNVAGYTWAVSQDGTNTPYLKLNNTISKTYRVAAKTDCDGVGITFAVSNSTNNPNDIADSEYSSDGIIKLDTLGNESPTGLDYYYKNFQLPVGSYNVFYKASNSNTPVKVISSIFS